VHAQFTVSDATLDTCAGLANELGIPLHIHVAEDNADEVEAISQHQMRAVQRLAKHNALNSKSMLAHCIHIDDAEMDLVQAAGAKVMHQPRSNMNNGVGAARVQTMLERGICVGLGNDGFSNDAFAEMTICDKLHKVNALDPRAMGADKITGMVYQNNAKIAQMFFPQTTGVLAAGSPGDVILMDYHPFTEIHKDNVPWHMVFGMDGGMVTHTIVGGRVLMADRKLLTLDEAEIAAKGKEVSARAWKKFWQICEAEGDK
jgi:cytosine/adenosine deaminase-related metal-dependent hydrolase